MAKSNSTGVATAGRIANISARANSDPAMNSISSSDRNGGQIGEINAKAKINAMKRPITSRCCYNGIANRARINPRAMMKHGIREDLVKKALNYVLRTMLSRPRSNPVQERRRMNFKPTKSRFHPDFTSKPPSTSVVAAKSGNEDLVREAVSWMIKSRLSTPTCCNLKSTPIRTPIRTLESGCLFTIAQPVIPYS